MNLWRLFHVFSLAAFHCQALKIFEDSLNATEYKLFYHRTADFGPQPATYNVSGRLQLMNPLLACSIGQYITSHEDQSIQYHQIYHNEIVLVLRGNCTFSSKVRNAELLGAIGVIVGDYNTSQDEWIIMSKDPVNDDEITIPSVFVPHNTYQWISKLLASYSSSSASSLMRLEGDDPMESRDRLTVNNMQSAGVYVLLDSDGEYVAPNSEFWLAAFGIVIVIIPTLWCFIVCVALVRRKIVRYVQRTRRLKRLNHIPIILFEPHVAVTDAAVPMATEGDNYLKLENIEQDATDETVKKEEEHSKHDVDAGSLSTNLKSMSRFLLDQFRGKKMYSRPHNDSCAICLDDFSLNEELRLLPCNHGFHRQCVDPWLTKSSELCPMCKQSIFVNEEDGRVSGGCLPSISKVCCIRHANRNDRRRREENDGNERMINEEDVNNEDGLIVLAAGQDELVSIESVSDVDSNHSHSDVEDNIQLEQE
eukprot:80369_1